MTRRPFLLVGLTVFAGWACNLNAVRDGSPLSFAIAEGYYVDSPPPPQIVLLVATETQYPCLGYRLEAGLDISGTMLRVNLSGRVKPPGEVCATAIGPAGFSVALPITTGTYSLEFTRDGVTDHYSVTVTDTAIEITTLESSFTHPTALSFPRAS